MEAQSKLVAQLEKTVKELRPKVEYLIEKINIQGKNQDEEEGGRNLFTIKTSGVSVKEHPLKGNYEGNNDEAKATDKPYEINQGIGQEKEW